MVGFKTRKDGRVFPVGGSDKVVTSPVIVKRKVKSDNYLRNPRVGERILDSVNRGDDVSKITPLMKSTSDRVQFEAFRDFTGDGKKEVLHIRVTDPTGKEVNSRRLIVSKHSRGELVGFINNNVEIFNDTVKLWRDR